MATTQDHIGRLRAYEEPNGSFAVDNTANMDAAFKDVPYVEGSLKFMLERPTETPGFAVQRIDKIPRDVLLPKRGKISFDTRLAALGLATGGPRPQSALGLLLRIAMGGAGSESLQTGTTITGAGSTTTSLTVTSAAGLVKGGAVALPTGAGGRIEAREIANIVSNTVTLKYALSSAPAAATPVYASATYAPEAGTGDIVRSGQFSFKSLNSFDRWNFFGCQVSGVTLNLPNGGQPTISWEWTAADWGYDDAGAAVAAATYANTIPLVIADSEYRVHVAATSALANTLIPASEHTMNLQLAYEPVMTPGGANNILQWVRVRQPPLIAGEFVAPYDWDNNPLTWWTARDGGYTGTEYAVNFQIGSSPLLAAAGGGCVLLSAPSVQIIDAQREPIGGIAGQRVKWKGSTDAQIVSPAAAVALEHAAFRVHLF